ncbi:MAG: universal stress protein [Rhodospirillales bacterium]|nr:universal stress protein [Rhodospirillales bacterium]
MFPDEDQSPPYRSIVALLGPDTQSPATLSLAVKAAQRLGSSLTALFVSPNLTARAVGEALKSRFLDDIENASVTGHWQELAVVPGDDGLDLKEVRAATRIADFVFVSHETAQSLLATNRVAEIPYHLVRESGRPVVFLPPNGADEDSGAAENFATRVTIAWDGGREATRAVRDALPLLSLADDVIVLSVDSDRNGETTISGGRDIAKYLTAHGIPVRLHQTYVAHGDVGGTILSRASEARSNLVVMGACAHPHTLDLSLGKATRHVLDNMTVPVLMSC